MNGATLLEAWDRLLEEPPQPGGLARRRVLPDAPLDLFAAVFWPHGQVGLQVELAGSVRIARERLPACRGLRFLLEGPRGEPAVQSLAIVLEDAGLREVFAVLGADLFAAAADADSPAAGAAGCLDRIAMWQGLLEQLPAAGLGDEAQRGLFGELTVLGVLHLETLDALSAVTAWKGPARAHQDFELDGVAVEVKTSLAKRHARLQIRSEKQLDETPLAALYLAHVALSESAAGASLNDLVADLRARLKADHAALNAFNLRLISAGYLDAHKDHYRDSRFAVERLRFFAVGGEFPRLVSADLPPGVGDLTYTIVADDLTAFVVDLADVAARIGHAHG